jgi:hypothetical protein
MTNFITQALHLILIWINLGRSQCSQGERSFHAAMFFRKSRQPEVLPCDFFGFVRHYPSEIKHNTAKQTDITVTTNNSYDISKLYAQCSQ